EDVAGPVRPDTAVAPPPRAPVRLTGELVLPAEPLVADRRFPLGLRLRNDGDGEARLRPERPGRAPTGVLRLLREDEPLGELALTDDGWETAFGNAPMTLAPGAAVTFELVRLRAPTVFGEVELRVEYDVVDERGGALPLTLPPARAQVAWTGLTVLHLGDSLVAGGLTQRLAQRVREAGGRYVTDCWVSSNAPRWLGSERLTQRLRDNLPEIVLVTLGTNEYEVGTREEYLGYYDRLASRLGAHRRCFWIGPPGLPGVDRFVEAARRRTAPCPFFDSSGIAPDSGRDRDHLSRARGEEWADEIWAWLGKQWRP
ncbi:MAG: SGNH/GDSL hydrolase family protein, partial [Deltaproteobacteria bacterium]|nr:SGNH/GDSL hydrolase family protein [Deltaproteobacteria bacterium]